MGALNRGVTGDFGQICLGQVRRTRVDTELRIGRLLQQSLRDASVKSGDRRKGVIHFVHLKAEPIELDGSTGGKGH